MTKQSKSASTWGANQLSQEQLDELKKAMVIAANRLRGARLAAGYVVVRDAAEQTGFSVATYRHAEASFSEISNALMESCARVFQVSFDYLRDGAPTTDRERLAKRVSDLLMTTGESGPDLSKHFPPRLRELRIEAGYTRVKDAALENGWPLPTYGAHEAGGQTIPIERMIAYALALGFRPEYAVLGELPKRPERSEAFDWVDLRAKGKLPTSESSDPWSWLRSSSREGIPLLIVRDGRVVLSNRRVSLPFEIFEAERPLPTTVFAVISLTDPSVILLVDSVPNGGGAVVAGPEGTARIDLEQVVAESPQDPTKHALKKETVLGEFVGRIVLSMS